MTEQEYRNQLLTGHLLAVLNECSNVKGYAYDIAKWLDQHDKEQSWEQNNRLKMFLFYIEADLTYALEIMDKLKKDVGIEKWVEY